MAIEAVLWDFGGVFTASPFHTGRRFAEARGLDFDVLFTALFGDYHTDTDHPWHRVERGELGLSEGFALIHEAARANALEIDFQELMAAVTDVAATARFDRTGVWRIEEATGRIGAGEFRATATGQMKGLSFLGAEATVIASKEGIPISAEGATFAEATGEVKIAAKMSDDRRSLAVTVDIPRADVQLPDRSTQKLEPLEPDPTIAIGVRQKDGTLGSAIGPAKRRPLRRRKAAKALTSARACSGG